MKADILSGALTRYLDKRAIPGPWQVTGIKKRNYRGAVVIPACDEENWLFRALDSLAANDPEQLAAFMVLVVVNHPDDVDHRVRIANRRLLGQFTTSPMRSRLELGWIDACSEGLELKEGGVGPARKLGFDLALRHLATDNDPILISLDADTLVEPNYLTAINQHFAIRPEGGAVIPFAHQPADNQIKQQAIDVYETYLRCYVLGLALAGSPYAFHTIGSAMACRVSAYLGCGGMNRRNGGEDFYFLQSLAKTTGVSQVQETAVHPSARPSTRVPFGTGPAILELIDNPDRKWFYPLSAFELLGHWLQTVGNFIDLDGTSLLHHAQRLDYDLGLFLHRRKFVAIWDRIRKNHHDAPQRLKAFHTWFDGLKTQQLLKQVCSSDRSRMVSADDAITAFFTKIGLPRSEDLSENLNRLRQHQNFPDSTGK